MLELFRVLPLYQATLGNRMRKARAPRCASYLRWNRGVLGKRWKVVSLLILAAHWEFPSLVWWRWLFFSSVVMFPRKARFPVIVLCTFTLESHQAEPSIFHLDPDPPPAQPGFVQSRRTLHTIKVSGVAGDRMLPSSMPLCIASCHTMWCQVK